MEIDGNRWKHVEISLLQILHLLYFYFISMDFNVFQSVSTYFKNINDL